MTKIIYKFSFQLLIFIYFLLWKWTHQIFFITNVLFIWNSKVSNTKKKCKAIHENIYSIGAAHHENLRLHLAITGLLGIITGFINSWGLILSIYKPFTKDKTELRTTSVVIILFVASLFLVLLSVIHLFERKRR